MTTGIRIFVCCFVIVFLTQCVKTKENHVIKSSHFFQLNAYMSCEDNRLLFSINENDIEAVDWPNQSYKLKKSKLESLRNSEEIYRAFYATHFVLSSNNRIIDTLGFIELESSCGHAAQNDPLVCQFAEGIFSNDGWIVIVPYVNSRGFYHCQLFNDQIYNKFKQMKLLKACNWQLCDSTLQVPNAPNKSFFKDFGARFNDEVRLYFGDSLQNDIDELAFPCRKVVKHKKENTHKS